MLPDPSFGSTSGWANRKYLRPGANRNPASGLQAHAAEKVVIAGGGLERLEARDADGQADVYDIFLDSARRSYATPPARFGFAVKYSFRSRK